MGQHSKIDWCDATWNPVTGCLHGCEYCYARRIAERFSGSDKGSTYGIFSSTMWRRVNPESELKDAIFEISEKRQPVNKRFDAEKQVEIITRAPYPFGFKPTFHKYRLDEPQKWKKPKSIFVCSMADLFGEWVPEDWIKEVFEACVKAPWHRYIFLTKNPKRYIELYEKGIMPIEDNFWYGSTVICGDTPFYYSRMPSDNPNTFVSIEPIQESFGEIAICGVTDWIIVGAETGNRKGKVVPEKEWIMDIADVCKNEGVPLFMKESLRGIMGDDFKQEFPWEVKK